MEVQPTERFVSPLSSANASGKLVNKLQKQKRSVCLRLPGCIEASSHEESKRLTARLVTLLVALSFVVHDAAHAASDLEVRYKEGLTHGFLMLSTLDGKQIALGDLLQVAHGSQVTSRLVYHFNDGSLQDETTVFSQRRSFSLITYHLVQKGPTFPHPSEVWIDTGKNQVTVRYTDDKGNEKSENEHMKLLPDVVNGLLLTLLKNLHPEGELPQVSMVVATPKPRIVKLSIGSQGKDELTIAGSRREALHYVIKIEIGGVAGLLASWLGKQPPDAHVWITAGEAPTFVKSETLSFLGGPVWRTELVAPVWPKPEGESKNPDGQKH